VIDYVPIGLQLAAAAVLAGAILGLSTLLARPRRSRTDLSPYECGVDPIEPAGKRYTVRFYMVAMLFILFDVEAVFLYPWAILLRELKMFGFWEMLVYIGIVLVGLFYIWKKGVLEWSEMERGAIPMSDRAFLDAISPTKSEQPELAQVGAEESTHE
jgi:NADH-quinone oxidoreductase subunit A